jgi:hypothetical protein
MGARRGLSLASALAVLLSACATTPPPPAGTTTSLGIDAAVERLAQSASAEGLTIERETDGVTVRTDNRQFINCRPVSVGGGGGEGSRNVFTPVDERRATADVRLASVGGQTQATWQTSFTGRYRNRVNNTTFERACESTGALEALFVRSLAGS